MIIYLFNRFTGMGGRKGSDSHSTAPGDKGGITVNPLTWLMSPHQKLTEKFCIMDHDREFLIDKKYRNVGVKEGWLVYDGYFHNEYEEIVHIYRHV